MKLKAEILAIKNIVIELIWNSTTAASIPNLLSGLGIDETSELDPYYSKRKFLADVLSKVSDDDFLKFCAELKYYFEDPAYAGSASDEVKFRLNLSEFESALNRHGAGYARKSNSTQIFFGALGKPDFFMEADTGLWRDRTESSLIYNGPYRNEGILNSDLKKWFGTSPLKAKYVNLIERLEESVQTPSERDFFLAYYSLFARPEDNVLLPQVWLNWEPMSLKQRGSPGVPQRMDFLWCGPNNKYVVVELDGPSHFASDGLPDEAKYVRQIANDRDLTLRGFQVFRFGNKEIADWKSKKSLTHRISEFFNAL